MMKKSFSDSLICGEESEIFEMTNNLILIDLIYLNKWQTAHHLVDRVAAECLWDHWVAEFIPKQV